MPSQQIMAQKPFGPIRENLEYRAPPKRAGGVRPAWPAMVDIPPLMDDSGIGNYLSAFFLLVSQSS